jgi:hypothetical protein
LSTQARILGSISEVLNTRRGYTAYFRNLLDAAGIRPLRLPANSPDLNAHAERFVRSIGQESLRHRQGLANHPFPSRDSFSAGGRSDDGNGSEARSTSTSEAPRESAGIEDRDDVGILSFSVIDREFLQRAGGL